MAGVVSTGFEIRLVDEILSDINEDQLANVSPTLDQNADGLLGQLNGIVAAGDAELWDAMQAVYNAAYANTATGAALDEILALTGVTRLAAAPTRTVLQLTGTVGTVVPIGFQARNSSIPSVLFTTRASVTLIEVGDGPTLGRADVLGYANIDGPTAANPDTVQEIVTPVAGVTLVGNGGDVSTTVIGRFLETDEEARLRRVQLLFASGNATVDAIRDGILRVADVTSVSVFENDTSSTDVDGVPPHAIEALVIGGLAQDIVNAIGRSKAAGIEAYGNENGGLFYVDTQGFSHPIDFSRPIDMDLKAAVTVETDDDFPADGAAQIKTALRFYISELGVGADVKRNLLFGVIEDIPGITDVTVLQVALLAGVLGTANIPIAARSKAVLATTDVTVTLV